MAELHCSAPVSLARGRGLWAAHPDDPLFSHRGHLEQLDAELAPALGEVRVPLGQALGTGQALRLDDGVAGQLAGRLFRTVIDDGDALREGRAVVDQAGARLLRPGAPLLRHGLALFRRQPGHVHRRALVDHDEFRHRCFPSEWQVQKPDVRAGRVSTRPQKIGGRWMPGLAVYM